MRLKVGEAARRAIATAPGVRTVEVADEEHTAEVWTRERRRGADAGERRR